MNDLKKVVKILTFFCVLVGCLVLWRDSLKLLKTATELCIINDNIAVYNEQYRKTDVMTAEVKKLFEEREEKFYNSDDIVVRIYSNSCSFLKLFFIIVSLGLVVLMPIVLVWNIICFTCKKQIKKMMLQQKRIEQEKLARIQKRKESAQKAEEEYNELLKIILTNDKKAV